ncbi:hypothetical protein RI367_004119 [Sorochytrium milnesiophthora]
MSHPAPAPALAPAPAPAPGEAHAPPAIGVQDHGNGDLYRLTFMPVLRTSVRQQTTTATTLDAWEVECDGVDSLARLLWQRFEGHLRNRAVSDNSVEPATWSMSAVAPTIRDIDKYLAVERSSRKYVIAEVNSVLPANHLPITAQLLHNWSSAGQALPLNLYKFGVSIATAAQFRSFSASVLQPATVDRAGAAAEGIHRQTLVRLQEIHGGVYAGHHINWRVWANYILTLSVHEQAAALLQPPPPHIILLFTRAPGNPEQHMRQLRDSMSFARDVLDSSKANLQSLRQSLVDTMGRLEGFQRVLDVQERALVAFETMIGPLQGIAAADALRDVPDAPDVDHMEM